MKKRYQTPQTAAIQMLVESAIMAVSGQRNPIGGVSDGFIDPV